MHFLVLCMVSSPMKLEENMLSNLHAVVTKRYLAIPEKYSELLTSLRTAYATELDLDKKQTSYDDLLDSLRLALKAYNFE